MLLHRWWQLDSHRSLADEADDLHRGNLLIIEFLRRSFRSKVSSIDYDHISDSKRGLVLDLRIIPFGHALLGIMDILLQMIPYALPSCDQQLACRLVNANSDSAERINCVSS
jgi:hypothetical protein